MPFDIAGARKAGYSDEEITGFLASSGGTQFDFDGARAAGYSDSEMLDFVGGAKPKSASLMDRAKDVGISALKGAISVPEAVVGLYDIGTGGRAGKFAEENLGFQPKKWKAALDAELTPEQQAANQAVSEAKGFTGTIKSAIENPSVIAHAAVESLPAMALGGLAGRGVSVLGKVAPWAAGAIGEGVVGAGSSAESIRQGTENGELTLGQSGAALASGIGTAAFGAAGGRIAHKLGIADVDTMLAGGPSNLTSKGVARRIVEGGISEGVFEELPQSTQEQIWQNVAMNKPLLDGVPEAAGMGLVTGAAMGGLAGGSFHGKAPAPTVADIGNAESVDGAIAAAVAVVDAPTQMSPGSAMANEVDALERNAGMGTAAEDAPVDNAAPDVAPQELPELSDIIKRGATRDELFTQREDEIKARENTLREHGLDQLTEAERDNQVEQAEALTKAQGFDNAEPTAIQLAMQQAIERRKLKNAPVSKLEQSTQPAPALQASSVQSQDANTIGSSQSTITSEYQRPGPQNDANTSAAAVPVSNASTGSTQNTEPVQPTPQAGRTPIAQPSEVRPADTGASGESAGAGVPAANASVEQQPALTGIKAEVARIKTQRAAVAPAKQQSVMSEDHLEDFGLLREFGGRWQYKFSFGSSWMTANTKEDAVDRATATYHKAPESERMTRAERGAAADVEYDAQNERLYGKKSLDELYTERDRLSKEIAKSHKAGAREFNGNGGRRTGAAVSNEAARAAGGQKMRLESYIKKREESRPAESSTEDIAPTNAKQPRALTKEAAVERYLGRYGKGMSGPNARLEAQMRNKRQSEIEWRAEPNDDLGYDKFEVVGYRKDKTNAKAPESSATGSDRRADVSPSKDDISSESKPKISAEEEAKAEAEKSPVVRSMSAAPSIPESERLSVGAIMEQVDQLIEPFATEIPITVLDSVTDLGPVEMQGYLTSGVTMNGRIHLFRDGLRDRATVARTLWHELLHFGLRRFLTQDQYIKQMDKLYLNDAWVHNKANEWIRGDEGKELMDQGYSKPYIRARGTDEALAALAEILQTEPTGYRSNDLLAKTRRAVREWVAKMADLFGFHEAAKEWRGYAAQKDARDLITSTFSKLEEGVEPDTTSTRWQHSDPAFSRAPMPDWLKSMPKETQDAAKKAGIWQEQKPLKDRLKELRNKAVKEFQQGVFDQFAPLMKLGEREYVLARLTKSADAPLESLLLYGKPFLNDAGAVDVKLEKGGLIGALQQLQGEHDRFFAWIAGNRAAKLKLSGRENLFTDADISALKDLSQGKMSDGKSRAMLYEVVRGEFNAYSKSVLDISEKAGIINGPDRSIWESDFYVPFYRVMEDQQFTGPKNVSGMVNQYAFKKLKGGTEDLSDLMQNTLRNWSHLLSASLKNQAASAAISTAEKAGIATPVTAKQKGAVTILEAGKEKHFMIEDPFIMDAITSLEWAGWNNPAMKAMTNAKHYLTLGVTIAPAFKVRNLAKDQLAAVAVNPVSYNIMNNLVEGWKGTDKESEQYAKMLTGGGLMRFGTFLEDDRAANMKRLINNGVKASSILDTKTKVKDAIKAGYDWWQEAGDRSENITRAAIYKQRYEQVIKDGMTDDEAHLMASFAARDSMDFSLQGKWTAIRFLTQIVPFMNARLQGLYKLGREGIMPSGRMLAPQLFGDKKTGDKAKAMRFGAVTGSVALASIALMLAYKDDDDWKNREEWDRDTYWWFKVGGTAYRIPKPFEIGAIGTIAERGLETVMNGMDKESRKLFVERLGSMVTQTFSMNPIPQLFKPMIDLYANTDSFTGRQIESQGMERLSKSERVGQSTSATAQLAGKATSLVGLSPVQVDFLVNSYFSWLGTHLVMTADFATRPMMGLPEKPARKWPDDYFVLGDFAKGLPASQSKYITKFYEQAQEVQQAMADIRYYQGIGNTIKAHELIDENRDKIQMSEMYSHASQQLGEINRRIKIIQARNMDADVKRDEIDRMMQMKIKLTKIIEEKRVSRQTESQE